jgi:hypothetical protein
MFVSAKKILIDLMLALEILQALPLLPLRHHSAHLLEDLLSFEFSVLSSDFDITSVATLLKNVVDNAPDAEIWSAVYMTSSLGRRLLHMTTSTPKS